MEKSNYTFYLLLCGVLCLARVSCQQLYCGDARNRCTLYRYDGYSYEVETYENKNMVTNLTLTECNINYISSEIFRQLPNLQVLHVSNCNLSDIRPDTFKSASNLMELKLKGNDLNALHSSMFEGANNLKYIDLSYNQINTIGYDTFKGLPKLMKIDLSYNKLTNESVQMIGNLHNLEELTFSANDLKSLRFLKNLPNLSFLDLSYNQFHLIPSTDAEVFKSLVNLKHLVLKDVGLSKVLDVYANYIFTSGLELLDISDNNLEIIDIRYLMKLDNLRELNISGNPFIRTQAFQGAISLVFPNLRILGNAEFFRGKWQWQCTDIAMLFKATKNRGIEIQYNPTWGLSNYYKNFEGILCSGEQSTYDYTKQHDEDNRRFDELRNLLWVLSDVVNSSNNNQYTNSLILTGVNTMTIIILSIIVVLLGISIANIILFICLGRRFNRMKTNQSYSAISDERTKLIQ